MYIYIYISNSLALCTRHRALLHNAILMGVMETLRAEFAGTIFVVELCLYLGEKFPHVLTILKHFEIILTPLGTILTIYFCPLATEPILDDFREKGVTSRLPTPPPAPGTLFRHNFSTGRQQVGNSVEKRAPGTGLEEGLETGAK